jgi:hypothetical protein
MKQYQLNHVETRLDRLPKENRCGEPTRAILPNPRAIGQAGNLPAAITLSSDLLAVYRRYLYDAPR